MRGNQKGYTLVEMVLVMAIFVVVIMLTGESFKSILNNAAKVFKSEESNLGGVIGLETLRHDLNQAGFGLFTEAGIAYTGEAANGTSALLNDPLTGPPRPVWALERNTTGCAANTSDQPDNQGYKLIACSDYLSVKATNLSLSSAAQRWTYLNFFNGYDTSNHQVTPAVWPSAGDNPRTGDSVVLISKKISATSNSSTLVPTTSGGFYYQFSTTAFNSFTSQSASSMNVYGVDTQALRMPFNRADFFVATPPATSQVSSFCAPNTGVLYKAFVNQTDGKLTYLPLLDCVAGMQVVLGWDTNGDGAVDSWSNADGSTVSGLAAGKSDLPITKALSQLNNSSTSNGLSIRNSLKMIKIYVLAQNGRLDRGYVSPSSIVAGDDGEENITKRYDIAGAGWLNYRWKLYTIVAIPKNLNANQ